MGRHRYKDYSSDEMNENENKKVYEVEKVVNHKDTPNGRYLFLKWKGFPRSQNTWEPIKQLECPELIAQYYKRISFNPKPLKPIQQTNFDKEFMRIFNTETPTIKEIKGAMASGKQDVDYAVVFEGHDAIIRVPSNIMREKYAEILIDYFENNLVLMEGAEKI